MEKDLKEKYELQALFDLSKALNSSLNLKTILNTIILTPMGKLLIAKGLVLIAKGRNAFAIETLKGLPKSLLGQVIEVETFPTTPSDVSKLSPSPWQAFLTMNDIEIVLPITYDGKELGIIGFGKKILNTGFTDSDLDYLHSLSNIAATAVQNGIIFSELNNTNRKLEKKVQELNTLSEIVRELNSTLSTLKSEGVVNLLAYSIMGEMMVNRCLIFLDDAGCLNLTLNKGMQSDKISELAANESQIRELMQISQPMLLSDDLDSDVLLCLKDAGVTAVIPMRVENKSKGVIALGEKITRLPFVKDELDFLSILGNWSMISIETARLIEQELEKQKLEEELRIASEIQRQLLPKSCPTIDGYEIAAINLPSLQVGGDYYDCIKLADNEYLFCIADVSGKGAPAALLMSNLQAGLRALVNSGLQLNEIVGRINDIIYGNTSYDKFITAFFCTLKTDDGLFTSVNAGHNFPYVFHGDGSFQTLEKGGLILGMMPNIVYEVETTHLQNSDCVVMFTDGVSEAMDKQGNEFEEYRIEECASRNLDVPAQTLLDRLIADVKAFSEGAPQADDITALIVSKRRHANSD